METPCAALRMPFAPNVYYVVIPPLTFLTAMLVQLTSLSMTFGLIPLTALLFSKPFLLSLLFFHRSLLPPVPLLNHRLDSYLTTMSEGFST